MGLLVQELGVHGGVVVESVDLVGPLSCAIVDFEGMYKKFERQLKGQKMLGEEIDNRSNMGAMYPRYQVQNS